MTRMAPPRTYPKTPAELPAWLRDLPEVGKALGMAKQAAWERFSGED